MRGSSTKTAEPDPGLDQAISSTRLPNPQEAALRALLDARSLAVAAREAGVTAKTVSRWRREDPAFREALEAGLQDLRAAFEDRRVALMETAFTTLHEVMVDAVDSRSRVRAAELVFRFFGQRVLAEEQQARLEATLAAFTEAGRQGGRQAQSRDPEF
jgi:hypothetical protein